MVIFPLIQVGLSSGAVHRALAEQLLSVDDFLSFKAMRRDGTAREPGKKRLPGARKSINIRWMEEILHQLVTIGNYKTLQIMGLQWDKPSTNWCRISSIHSRENVEEATEIGCFMIFPFMKNWRRQNL